MARFDSTMAMSVSDAPFLQSALPAAGEADLRMSWNGATVRAAVAPLLAELSSDEQAIAEEFLEHIGTGHVHECPARRYPRYHVVV